MKISGRKTTVVLCLASALMFDLPSPASADAPVVWRMHTPHTTGRIGFDAQEDWANAITEATDGRVEVEIYPGGALGFKDADILGALKAGLIESSYVYGGYYSRDEPVLSLILPQMVFKTREEMLEIFPLATEQYAKLYKEWGVHLASIWPTLTCNIAAIGKEPYGTVESMEGEKIRVWEAQQADTLQKLDVSALVIPQNDLYLAFKTGTVDGAVHYPEAIKELSLYEDAEYFSLMQPVPVAQGIGISELALQALSKDLRETVLRASEEHHQKWLGLTRECHAEDEAIAWAISHGVERLPDFSDEDRELISEAAIEVWRDRAADVGDEAVQYQQLMEEKLMNVRAEAE